MARLAGVASAYRMQSSPGSHFGTVDVARRSSCFASQDVGWGMSRETLLPGTGRGTGRLAGFGVHWPMLGQHILLSTKSIYRRPPLAKTDPGPGFPLFERFLNWPNSEVTESYCLICRRYVAASANPRLINMAESGHSCAGSPPNLHEFRTPDQQTRF